MRGQGLVDRSSAVPLALAWLALIVYASLFPFGPWRWPPGLVGWAVLDLPWPRYFIPFDISSNLLGYAPLGLLVGIARLRHGAAMAPALLSAIASGAGLSYAMEAIQHLLPQRVPSALDWVLNTAGAGLGALLALAGHRWGLLKRWQAWRDRWLERGQGGALALLVLWPVALLFPTPVPLGVGQIGEVLRTALSQGLAGVPWVEPWSAWLDARAGAERAMSPLAEALAIGLGMLSPCLLAYAASPPGGRRVGLALGLGTAAVAATTLSTLLNFGPDHALAWCTRSAFAAMAAALLLALASLWLKPRLAGALALVSLTGLVTLVHQAPTDPYFAQSLLGWEQGRFVRFHGLAQWVGWLWPYAALTWLLGRIGSR